MGVENKNSKGEHPVVHYLKTKGIQIPDSTTIPPPIDPLANSGGVTPPQIQRDAAPSRQRMNKSADKMTTKLDSKGVSKGGGEKLDKSKMQTRNSWDYDFMEPEDYD